MSDPPLAPRQHYSGWQPASLCSSLSPSSALLTFSASLHSLVTICVTLASFLNVSVDVEDAIETDNHPEDGGLVDPPEARLAHTQL